MATRATSYQMLEKSKKSAAKFEVCKKDFFLTYSQCPLEKADLGDHLLSLGPEVVVVVQEHHKSGDLHLHCWLEFSCKKHIRNERYFDYKGFHPSIGSTRDPKMNTRKNALGYMAKEDDDPWTFGIDLQSYVEAKKKHRAVVGEMIVLGKKTVREVVQEFPQEIYNLDKLMKNANLFKVLGREIPQFIERKNFWICGLSGVGKSYMVRMLYGTDLFMKSINKWWDGYAGEPVVLLDDFGKEHKVLSYHMKIWADNYAFNGEVKGGMIVPGYKQLIVTSNYFPEDIWPRTDDPELLSAITRRFTVIEMHYRDDQQEIMARIGGYELYESFRDLAKYSK